MSSFIPYEKPKTGDVWISVWPDSTETATVIGVKETTTQWLAVLSGGFRNPYRIAQGEGWSSRAQWHPLKDDHLLFPKDTKAEPSAPPDSTVEVTSTRKRGAV
jgi:hypothetical protein